VQLYTCTLADVPKYRLTNVITFYFDIYDIIFLIIELARWHCGQIAANDSYDYLFHIHLLIAVR